jgi:hypothetical protein
LERTRRPGSFLSLIWTRSSHVTGRSCDAER